LSPAILFNAEVYVYRPVDHKSTTVVTLFQWKKISIVNCHARNRDDAAQLMTTRVFTKPARENMLSTGMEDALNLK